MSQAVNINLSGTCQIDGGCIPCMRISHGVVISPWTSCGIYKTLAHVRLTSKRWDSKDVSFICKASFNGHRRNPDFNQRHRQGFSESNNWKNEETGSSESLEHRGYSSVTDGLMDSLTSTPRFKVTETPGPREKEIVELFRKIQAQLRERSTFKEQKMESMRGKVQEKGNVDSLLKLLRKHSSEQGVRKLNGNANSELDTENHSVQNGVPNGFEKTGFPNASNHTSYESKKPNASSSTRPVSYFRRSSPISQTKNLPPLANRRRSNTDCRPYIRNKNVASPPEPARELDVDTELAVDPQFNHEPESDISLANVDAVYEVSDEESSNINSNIHIEEGLGEDEPIDTSDFSTLKVVDLRSIAKSHGVKGFSKLKKSELVELLSKSARKGN